jgi:DNA-binding Xre family transcriptional regulator
VIRVRLREAIHRHERSTGEKVTYSSLARSTGLSRSTIEAIGSRPGYQPSLYVIDQLCTALRCELAELLERVPPRAARKGRYA